MLALLAFVGCTFFVRHTLYTNIDKNRLGDTDSNPALWVRETTLDIITTGTACRMEREVCVMDEGRMKLKHR
jgi:hypothetical protein